MNVWLAKKWIDTYNESSLPHRCGLRLRFDQNVHMEVRRSCKEFCKWLRTLYVFPIRIPIYFKSSRRIRALDSDIVVGTFLGPDCKHVEPYIRIAVGDYLELEVKRGQDNALASILQSIAHELTHYFQWINSVDLEEKRLEHQANACSKSILKEYALTRDHP